MAVAPVKVKSCRQGLLGVFNSIRAFQPYPQSAQCSNRGLVIGGNRSEYSRKKISKDWRCLFAWDAMPTLKGMKEYW